MQANPLAHSTKPRLTAGVVLKEKGPRDVSD